ncbi:MAG TPA: S9 family peptidase, partial [Aggregicoccus sp.]|nr:S9 family peptidase [Aggregicoccus sp.]
AALWVIGVDDGKLRQLHPAAGARGPIHGARFSEDGERVFVASEQEGGRGGLLLALDARSGRELARFAHPAPLRDLQVAPEGGRVAVLAGAPGAAELRLLDARTLKQRAHVRLPPGELELGHFSEDGAQLTLTWREPGGRSNIFVLDVDSGRVRALRKDGAPSLPSPSPR